MLKLMGDDTADEIGGGAVQGDHQLVPLLLGVEGKEALAQCWCGRIPVLRRGICLEFN